MASTFATIAFRGDRFNGKYLSVGALPALTAYRELVIEIAKAIWREDHSDHSRLPRGFAESFDLGLGGISHGSKIAELPRVIDQQGQLPISFADDYFSQGQELLSDVGLVNDVRQKIPTLPDPALRQLEKLKKSIRSSEDLRISTYSIRKKRIVEFQLDHRNIDRILLESRTRKLANIQGVGFVVGISDATSSIDIVCNSGRFKYPIPEKNLRDGEILIGKALSFSIRAQVDAQGHIRSVEDYGGISPVLVKGLYDALTNRLKELETYSSGWMDGEGEKVDSLALLKAKEISAFIGESLEECSVFASLDGGVNFEWNVRNLAASLTVEGHEYILGVSDLASDRFYERSFKKLTPAILAGVKNIEEFLG